jgi:hypothetical protein
MMSEHLLIPVLGLLIPIVAIVAHHLAKAYGERQRHLTIREYVRAGQPVPPELLADAGDAEALRTRHGPGMRLLLPATINLALGLGLMGMFAVISPGSWLWGIGLVPLCLGLGLGLTWAVLRKQPSGA